MTHQDRYEALQEVRIHHPRPHHDVSGRTITLDGQMFTDIPGFYLHLGEAVGGPGGYFGAGLDALSDCLCGGFGIALPLTVQIQHPSAARTALDGAARIAFLAEFVVSQAGDRGDLIEAGWIRAEQDTLDLLLWAAIQARVNQRDSFDRAGVAMLAAPLGVELRSYFDDLIEVFKQAGVTVMLTE